LLKVSYIHKFYTFFLGLSLNLGGYERVTPKQKQLGNERQQEYRQYLAEVFY